MKILAITHTDLDGAMSGAVVGLKHLNDEVTYRFYNYGWSITPEELQGYDLIYATDISFNQGGYEWVYKTPNLIWYDHHIGAIRYSQDPEHKWISELPGKRQIGIGACEVVWNDLFPGQEAPLILQYLSAYDVWDKSRFNWEEVEEIEYGVKNKFGISPQNLIDYILQTGGNDLSEFKQIGHTILGYVERMEKGKILNNGYYIPDFHGYKVMALNTQDFSSMTFMSYYNPIYFDVMMPFAIVPSDNEAGKQYVRCSLYTENKDIDVSLLAKRYGGSGHKGASGMQISVEELMNILSTSYPLKSVINELQLKPKEPRS